MTIDARKLKASLKAQREKEDQAALEKARQEQEKRAAAEAHLVGSVSSCARRLQSEIEKAIERGDHGVAVTTNSEIISAIIDYLDLDRHPDKNPFREQFSTRYGNARYDNPFRELWEPLNKLGMRWSIRHTAESRDIDYRHDAYDTLYLEWGPK